MPSLQGSDGGCVTESEPLVPAWKWKVLAGVAAGTVAFDQVTKIGVTRFFDGEEGATKEIIPGFFNLVLAHNPGAAWGLLGNIQPDALRIAVFVVISISAVAMVMWLAWKARPDQKLLVWSSALVLGGAIGNLVDRLLYGRVIDFLDVYTHAGWLSALLEKLGRDPCHATYGCHWPAFNVADIAISAGVFLLATEGFFTKKEAAPAVTKPAEGQGSGS